jgi:hypothetical protein
MGCLEGGPEGLNDSERLHWAKAKSQTFERLMKEEGFTGTTWIKDILRDARETINHIEKRMDWWEEIAIPAQAELYSYLGFFDPSFDDLKRDFVVESLVLAGYELGEKSVIEFVADVLSSKFLHCGVVSGLQGEKFIRGIVGGTMLSGLSLRGYLDYINSYDTSLYEPRSYEEPTGEEFSCFFLPGLESGFPLLDDGGIEDEGSDGYMPDMEMEDEVDLDALVEDANESQDASLLGDERLSAFADFVESLDMDDLEDDNNKKGSR